MAREELTNGATTTLSSAMGAGDDHAHLTSTATLPSTGQYRVRVDNELMLVTAGTSPVTVARAQEGTSATSHVSGAAVKQVLTAAALDNLVSVYDDAVYVTSGRHVTFNGPLTTTAGTLIAVGFSGTLTGGLVVNEAGGDSDTRIEGDTEPDMLWLDASADNLYLGGSTNAVQIGKGGEITLIGSATRWEDVRISGSMVRVGATSPTLGAFGPSGSLRTYRFDSGQHDEVEFEIQMPHAWKLGTKIYPHVHWAPVGTAAGNVVWQFDYSWASVGSVFAAPGTLTSDPEAAGGTAWYHHLTRLKSGGNDYIDGAGRGLSSMMVCRLHRDAGAGSDTLAADVAFIEFDIHYEVDSLGSSGETTK